MHEVTMIGQVVIENQKNDSVVWSVPLILLLFASKMLLTLVRYVSQVLDVLIKVMVELGLYRVFSKCLAYFAEVAPWP